MKVSFGTIHITAKAKELVNKILDSGRVSSGKYVREFEEKFAELAGAKEAVAVSSGTDADALALAVLYDHEAQRGDEIIVPSLSFVSTGTSVLQAGFTPVFVDIERDTLNINPEKIEEKITDKTRAIMPVHLMGKPAYMDEIMSIAQKHNLSVIEDAAEAHGAKYKNKNIGTIGQMGAYSLYIAHIITTVEGGIVITNDSKMAEILRSLRSHGRACKCKQCVVNTKDGYCNLRFKYNTDIRFIFERIGFSCKMNELEAAVGLGSLEEYDETLQKRRTNFHYIKDKFEKFSPLLYTIKVEDHEEIGPHAFPIIVGEEATFKRDELVQYLEKNGIDSRNLFTAMPSQTPAFNFLNSQIGQYPEAEYVGDNGLHIGIHQDLSEEHMDYVIEVLEKFLSQYS